MKPDRFELEIQDYLDGRLSDESRTAFEARIEADPELARRVRLDREVRGALRAETEADVPSPGFYTRARARFEESNAIRARGRAWFRPFSLETAGLAAAVVITAVVFVPRMGELALPELEGAPETPLEQPAATPRPVSAGRLEESTPVEKRESAEADSVGDTIEGKEKISAVGTAEALSDLDLADDEFAPSPAPDDSIEQGVAEVTVRDEAARAEAQYVFDAQPKDAPDRTRSSLSKQAAAKKTAGPPPSEPSAAPREDEYAGARRSFTAGVPDGFALPRGAVDPGAIATLRTPEEWARLNRLGLPRASPYRDGRRIVLVGARRTPFSCANLTVETGPDRYEIRLFSPVDPDDTATWGCGVELPDDGRTVGIVAPERNE